MWVNTWDEISAEWATLELPIPADSSPAAIAEAVDQACAAPIGSIPIGQGWIVRSHSRSGPILTIECRTVDNLLGILLVNDEENTCREELPNSSDRISEPHFELSGLREGHALTLERVTEVSPLASAALGGVGSYIL